MVPLPVRGAALTTHMDCMTAIKTVPAATGPTLLIDLDGTVFDFAGAFDAKLLELDPNHPIVPVHERLDYDYFYADGPAGETVRAAMNAPGLFRNLEPIPGAVEAIRAMDGAGFNVFLCTTPYPTNATCASEKYASVEALLGPAWIHRTILTYDKTLVRGAVLIDDKPLIAGSAEPSWRHLLFDQPYNRYVTQAPRLTGWDRWEDAVMPLLDLARV
jgi:5'-nucleotidase